jgi:microfibrillar-associated protein 1
MSATTAPRKPAPRLARPAAVYRRGQAPKGVTAADLSDSDEDEEAQGEEQNEDIADMPLRAVQGAEDSDEEDEDESDGGRGATATNAGLGKMNVKLRDVDIKEGKVIVAGREESGRTALEGVYLLLRPVCASQNLDFSRGGRIGRGRGRSTWCES